MLQALLESLALPVAEPIGSMVVELAAERPRSA